MVNKSEDLIRAELDYEQIIIDDIENKIQEELNRIEEIQHKIKELKESQENHIKRQKELLNDYSDKFKTDKYSYYWKKSESVKIVDEKEIPKEYIKEKITKSPDKSTIKADLKRDKVIPGTKLEENYSFQSIKLKDK